MKVKIYCLYDPSISKIRYIGRTKSKLSKRLNEHICKAKNHQKYYTCNGSHKNNWIKSLLKNGIRPKIKLLTEIEGWEESHIFEKKLIAKYLVKYNLVNGDDRGPGKLSKNINKKTELIRVSKLKTYFNNEDNKTNFYNTVYMYDLEGNLVETWKSVKFIEEKLGIKKSRITNHMNRFNSNIIPFDLEGYYFNHTKYLKYPYIRQKSKY